MNTLNVVGAVAFSAVFAYLFDFFRFAAALAKRFPEDWERLGRPEMLGVVGQFKYLGVILGLIRISEEATRAFRGQIIRMRILLLVAFVGLIIWDVLTG